MTTDITELALLVSKAKASVFTLKYISQFEPADIDSDDVDLRFEVDGVETGTNVSIVDECGQAAKVIGALVEALRHANLTEAERQAYLGLITKRDERIEQLEKRNAYLEKRLKGTEESLIASTDMVTELESRTVKLPKRFCPEEYEGSLLWSETEVWNQAISACNGALRTAGIKVEDE